MRYKIVFMRLFYVILSLAVATNTQQNNDGQSVNHHHGRMNDVEGIHYNLTDQGYPYIMCDYQSDNHSHSRDGHITEDGKAIQCFKDHTKDERLGCFAVFEYRNKTINNITTSSLFIRTQGCWTHATDGIEHCVLDDLCVHNSPALPSPMFCCCTEHNCNKKVFMESELPMRKDMRTLYPPAPPTTQMTTNDQERERMAEHKRLDLIWVASGIIIGAVVVVAVISAILQFKWKRKNQKQVRDNEANAEGVPLVEVKPKPVCSHEPESVFEVSGLSYIGKGRFGAVSAGTWNREDGSTVPIAVKSFSKMDKDSFNHEIGIYILPTMKDCRCSHILRYLGWRHGINGDLWLITEYYSMGNLKEFLEKNVLSIDQSLRIMVTALEGLSYLHDERMIMGSHKPAIAHRDIKSKNILLKLENDTIQSVIGDFGLAMKLDGSLTTVSHGQVGTRRYMAPEVLQGAQQFTASAFRQVDVYAMGLVIWELLLRTQLDPEDIVSVYEAPFEVEVPGNPSLYEMTQAVVDKKIRPKFREEMRTHLELGQVATTCEEMWHPEAEGRVTAGCAMERIKKILGEESEGYHSGTSLSRFPHLQNGDLHIANDNAPVAPDNTEVPSPETEVDQISSIDETVPVDPSQT